MNKILVNKYLNVTSNAFAENRLLKVCFVLMVCIMLYNSHQINVAVKENKTVVIPAGSKTVFEISDSHANPDYYLAMARYIINLRGSLDYANVSNKLSELLLIVHPSVIGKVKEEFNDIEKQYKRYRAVSHNVILRENSKIEINNNIMTVQATKERIVGDRIVKKSPATYLIHFKIISNHFWLYGIEEKVQNEK